MKIRAVVIILGLLSVLTLVPAGPGQCERTQYLSVCQELVSSARSYEARAAHHNRVAKSLMMQIENVAKLPKNQGTIQVMDSLFNQYEENRALEQKFRQLYREATEESRKCMNSAE
jgi:hypothetical protein